MPEKDIANLGYARVDLDRARRCGFPEVVFAEGKAAEWLLGIVVRLHEEGQGAFATRVNEEQALALSEKFPQAIQDKVARTFWLPVTQEPIPKHGQVIVVTAGTSDLPVAKEAVNTAEVMGVNVELISDCGVAGLNRILAVKDKLQTADAVVVVAGMDGALPSVIGGLVACPVIACPTSVGYGASFGGLAALLTMLNACSAGVVTVNIDAGFKAGYTAALIARQSQASR